MVLMQVFSTHE